MLYESYVKNTQFFMQCWRLANNSWGCLHEISCLQITHNKFHRVAQNEFHRVAQNEFHRVAQNEFHRVAQNEFHRVAQNKFHRVAQNKFHRVAQNEFLSGSLKVWHCLQNVSIHLRNKNLSKCWFWFISETLTTLRDKSDRHYMLRY